MMPIRKPFIKLNIKSMLPAERSFAVENIVTDPCVGANPNFNTIITFSTTLPVEDIYCPALTCDVHDHVFLGLRQPTIGSFTIPIGAIKSKCEEHREQGSKIGQDIMKMLQDHLKLSVEEMKEQAERRADSKIDPETKKKLEERRKYLAQ